MIPPGSVRIKDYAIETPMKTSSSTSEGDTFHEARININPNNQISAINFVVKDEETGAWYQHKGRDFKVPRIGCLKEDANLIGPKRGFNLWPGTMLEGGKFQLLLIQPETAVFEDRALRTKYGPCKVDQLEGTQREVKEDASEKTSISAYTDGIINEIRNLVTDISSKRSQKTKSKEAQESILQEIERLAAEAYSIFRSSVPTFPEEIIVESEVALESETLTPPPNICSGTGTGTGYEILCQGFNWESHKSGRWYQELKEKAAELASLGLL